MIQRFLQQAIFLLLFMLTIGIANVQAQQPTEPARVFEDSDTMSLHDAMTPSPANAQLSEPEKQAIRDSLSKMGVALMRLREVINLKKDVLWTSQLQQTINGFTDSTYIMVEPLVKVQGRGALLGIVSLLGQITIGEPLDPYVKVYWVITPVTEQGESFKLTVQIDHSSVLPDTMIITAKNSMSSYYLNKVYQEIGDTETDILNAMNAFLSTLGRSAGDNYAPQYLLQVGGTNYRSGYSLNIFEQYQSADSIVQIHLVDRITEEKIEDSITWTGATNILYDHAEISKNNPRLYPITATRGGLTYRINIQIMSDDVLDVVLNGMRSVLDEALTDVMQLLADSAAARDSDYQNKREVSRAIRAQLLVKVSEASGDTESSTSTVSFTLDSTQVVSEPIGDNIRTNTFLGQYINKAQMEHLARMAFIFAWENRETLVAFTSSANREVFKQAVLDDIGRLAANMIVEYASGDHDQMKAFLIQFIMEKVTFATQTRLNTR